MLVCTACCDLYAVFVYTVTDQQDVMSDAAVDDDAMFMDSSVNESPYFVHEPSTNGSVKQSAKVRHAHVTVVLRPLFVTVCVPSVLIHCTQVMMHV